MSVSETKAVVGWWSILKIKDRGIYKKRLKFCKPIHVFRVIQTAISYFNNSVNICSDKYIWGVWSLSHSLSFSDFWPETVTRPGVGYKVSIAVAQCQSVPLIFQQMCQIDPCSNNLNIIYKSLIILLALTSYFVVRSHHCACALFHMC